MSNEEIEAMVKKADLVIKVPRMKGDMDLLFIKLYFCRSIIASSNDRLKVEMFLLRMATENWIMLSLVKCCWPLMLFLCSRCPAPTTRTKIGATYLCAIDLCYILKYLAGISDESQESASKVYIL